MKLAVVSTHPIQYNAPLFQQLAESERIQLRVFYTRPEFRETVQDREFGKKINWDIPLLDGYESQWSSPEEIVSDLRSWGTEALLVFGWNFPGHLRVMRFFHGKIPVLFRGDSNCLDERPGIRLLARRLFLRYVYRFIDKALVVGTNNREYFRRMGVPESKLVWAPHAIDNQRFFDDPEKRYEESAAEWRRKLGIPQEGVVVLYAGKFSPHKSVGTLIDQFLAVRQSRPDLPLFLVLIGEGKLKEEFAARTAKDPRIHILPFVNQRMMPVAYRLGNVLVLPSRHETWGLVINEAMACGRAVIASSRVGCAADLISSPERGWRFEPDRPEQLREILERLDRKKLAEIGQANRDFIRSWSFERIIAAIHDALFPQSRILAVFGNVACFGQERSNMEVFRFLLEEKHPLQVLVHDRIFHLHLEEKFKERAIPYKKIRFDWGIRRPRSWKKMLTFLPDLCLNNIQFLREYRRFRPDYIHIANDAQYLSLIPSLLCVRAKIVFRLGDCPVVHWPVYRLAWKYFISARPSRFVCISQYIATKLVEAGRRTNAKDMVIYNLPPLVDTAPVLAPPTPEAGRLKLGYIGQICRGKGVDLLLEAVSRLHAEYPGLELFLAGSGGMPEEEAELRRIAQDSPAASHIHWLGFLNDTSAFWRTIDLHVTPSRRNEALGNVVVEAKLHTRTSIVFPDGGLPEWIDHGQTGYICRDKTLESLEEAILFYLNNQPEITRQARKAFESAEDPRWNSATYRQRWSEVYKLL